jgi:hypothetical protein
VEGTNNTQLATTEFVTTATAAVSAATNTALDALDLKAPLASPAFTGTVSGITAAMVGLTNVDNIADIDKQLSSHHQTALDTKPTLSTANVFTDTTDSTNKTSGAITVGGGMGITKSLHVGGDVTASASSDKRLKTNITKIENPLVKLDKINGYTFDWIPTKDVHSNVGRDVGVIAQEIEEVLPEITVTRDNGYKAVRYEKIVPLLIECIKEQQKQIDELRRYIELK